MTGFLRRVRSSGFDLALLAGLTLLATLLVVAAPRLGNHNADRALRQDLAATPYAGRDLMLRSDILPLPPSTAAYEQVVTSRIDVIRGAMPAALREASGAAWGALSVPGTAVGFAAPAGSKAELTLRYQPTVEAAGDIVQGRWPNSVPDETVEVVLSQQIAGLLAMPVGTEVEIPGAAAAPLRLLVVGLFQPTDPAAPIWDDLGDYLETLAPIPEEPFQAGALTDVEGFRTAGQRTDSGTLTYRIRVDENRIDTGRIEPLLAALAEAKRMELYPGSPLDTTLDRVLTEFAGQLRAARALLAVVLAGLLATVLGLLILAARLSVERRREELTLVRARGGSTAQVGLRTMDEALVVVPLAAVLGWVLGTWVPGRPGGTDLAVLLVALVALLTVPTVAVLQHRVLVFAGRRHDLVRERASLRRLTAEGFVIVIAAAGVYLLRRRGLSGNDVGVDPYLASVPVLLAAAAAIVALRLYPGPISRLSAMAGRGRGAVAFLGLARAGRGAPIGAVSLAVLVVAISTAVFSGAVTTTVDGARDRVADRAVGADAAVLGEAFERSTVEGLAGVPGVTAVAPLAYGAGQVSTEDAPVDRSRAVSVLLVDGSELARVVADSGIGEVPPLLVDARPGGGPVPAVVSPAARELIGPDGTIRAFQRDITLTTDVVVDDFPGLPGATDRFVVLPWQAMADGNTIDPTMFLIAGDGFDPPALTGAADEGRIAQTRVVLGREVEQPTAPSTVVTWADRRAALDRTGANDVLTMAFAIGSGAGTALALLAVGFAVVAGARSRGQALSRLRTMGLSARQGRRLLVVELLPSVAVAVLAGGVVGVLLPSALRPALGLDAFTGGVTALVVLDPLLIGGSLALVVVALATAVLVETVANRRLRLGAALRLGEES